MLIAFPGKIHLIFSFWFIRNVTAFNYINQLLSQIETSCLGTNHLSLGTR